MKTVLAVVAVVCIGFVFASPAKPHSIRADSCPENDSGVPVYLPHETKCWLFYECSNGEPYLQSCPPGLYFDTTKDVCDANADCGGLSTTSSAPTDSPDDPTTVPTTTS